MKMCDFYTTIMTIDIFLVEEELFWEDKLKMCYYQGIHWSFSNVKTKITFFELVNDSFNMKQK